MELWIRSQDKKSLVKVNSILVSANFDMANMETYGYRVFLNDDIYIGVYRTEERCIEILDEIQKIINGEITMSKSVESQIVGYEKNIVLNVYEMPEE